MNEDTLEYHDNKLQLYLHAYDEGERNIQEFKRLTLNGTRNVWMLQNCWNKLSKRTIDWAEIRMTIEDQLNVLRNWNLHPSNPNLDMTGLKDAYRSGEENYLGKTGQCGCSFVLLDSLLYTRSSNHTAFQLYSICYYIVYLCIVHVYIFIRF